MFALSDAPNRAWDGAAGESPERRERANEPVTPT